jgi:ubiquitin carboxyl-terminal hydrolase 47
LYSRGTFTENTLIEHLYRGIVKAAKLIGLGVLEDYIQCKECNKNRARFDTFFDVQLVIRDVDDIYKALDKYVEPELLTEGNQYTCENCNKKVDALKGLRFKDLPFLLCLHLKRFDFDWATVERIKLNNRVSFPMYLGKPNYMLVLTTKI